MASYIKSARGKSWSNLSDVPKNPYSIESAIGAWLQSKSPVDANNPAFWRWRWADGAQLAKHAFNRCS